MENKRPIIIQGAMPMEVEMLMNEVKAGKIEKVNGYEFCIGSIDEYPVIISRTQVGVINASMSTCIAIQKYNPIAIINQGLAGAHVDYIHRNDIVVGEKAVNINSFVTGVKGKSEGTDPFEWQFDSRSFEVECNSDLLKSAKKIDNEKYKLFFGILGSGDIFNREVDRIKWIHDRKNTLTEDNESIAVYSVCKKFRIPCIGFRIISNNEVTQKESDGATSAREENSEDFRKVISKEYDNEPAEIVQQFAVEYVKKLIDSF